MPHRQRPGAVLPSTRAASSPAANTKVIQTFYFNDFHELEQWKVDRNQDLYDNKEISLHTLLNVCYAVLHFDKPVFKSVFSIL